MPVVAISVVRKMESAEAGPESVDEIRYEPNT
jgi:hypothetical protein